jgi:hypothetical protein
MDEILFNWMKKCQMDEYTHYNLEPTVFGVFGVLKILGSKTNTPQTNEMISVREDDICPSSSIPRSTRSHGVQNAHLQSRLNCVHCALRIQSLPTLKIAIDSFTYNRSTLRIAVIISHAIANS